jgi:hypothetical protein
MMHPIAAVTHGQVNRARRRWLMNENEFIAATGSYD